VTDERELRERLRAVERAVVDGDAPESLAEAGDLAARLDRVEENVDDLAERTLALEAAVQALRGYAGEVRRVDREVEARADAALAAVEALEARLDERGPGDSAPRAGRDGRDRR
jgi:chromosome segregation ATPase